MDTLLKNMGTMVMAITKAWEKRGASEGHREKETLWHRAPAPSVWTEEQPYWQKVLQLHLDPSLKAEPPLWKVPVTSYKSKGSLLILFPPE